MVFLKKTYQLIKAYQRTQRNHPIVVFSSEARKVNSSADL